MPWYCYFVVSGVLIALALSLGVIEYAVAGKGKVLRWTGKAAIVVGCLLLVTIVLFLILNSTEGFVS